MHFAPTIGIEVHAELATHSKMFCACPVVDTTQAAPNTAVCPVCAGMPGTLPVVNQRAVEYGLRVALALECAINPVSIFARKNYFYPDLPKGYQISQYDQPLTVRGRLIIFTSQGERVIRIRHVHLEEDTGKLTHVAGNGAPHSLVDLNRAGVPLLEIVTEPDLHTAEEVRLYAQALRSILQYVGVNSGDLQKGVLRIEPNVSVRPVVNDTSSTPVPLGIKVEIKNLNSFRALERGVAFEIDRQSQVIRAGQKVIQETRGWDELHETTFTQRVKEGDEDYHYFPDPDIPPLVLDPAWVETIRQSLPELPTARFHRFCRQYELTSYDAGILVAEKAVADYFEHVVAAGAPAKATANWVAGEVFGLLNQAGKSIEESPVPAESLSALVQMVGRGEINNNTAKTVLAEMFSTGKMAESIINEKGLRQVSDASFIAGLVQRVLNENPQQVDAYRGGKETLAQWFFGQVMRQAKGKANPQIVQRELEEQLAALKSST